MMAAGTMYMAVIHFFLDGAAHGRNRGLEKYTLASPWMVAIHNYLAVFNIGNRVKNHLTAIVFTFKLHAYFEVSGRKSRYRLHLHQLFVVVTKSIAWFERDFNGVAD